MLGHRLPILSAPPSPRSPSETGLDRGSQAEVVRETGIIESLHEASLCSHVHLQMLAVSRVQSNHTGLITYWFGVVQRSAHRLGHNRVSQDPPFYNEPLKCVQRYICYLTTEEVSTTPRWLNSSCRGRNPNDGTQRAAEYAHKLRAHGRQTRVCHRDRCFRAWYLPPFSALA